MEEKLFSFLPDQFPNPEAFFVELTGVTYPDPHYRIDRDRSPVLCLEYVISGQGSVNIGGQSFYPKAGDVYLLPMGLHHRYRSDPHNPWQKIWMNVRGTLCADLLGAYHLGETYHIPSCPLLGLFQEFVSVCSSPPSDPWELDRRCSLLFHELLSRIRATLSGLPKTSAGPAEQARDLLDRKLYVPVSVDDTAAAVGLSSFQLTRLFSARFGVTPYQYLLSRRLETACSLLRGTALPVREIAFRLCFSDEHYFSTLFHRKTGQTPSSYRRNQGQTQS